MGYSLENRRYQFNHEVLNRLKDAVQTVPYPLIERPDILYPEHIYDFDRERFIRNTGIIQSCHKAISVLSPGEAGIFLNDTYPILAAPAEDTARLMLKIKNSPNFNQELSCRFGRNMDASWSESLDELVRWYPYTWNNEKKIYIAPNHATDAPLVWSLAENGVSLRETAIIIYDSHGDFVQTGYPDNLFSARKATFIQMILAKGIGNIEIIGMSDKIVRECQTGIRHTRDGDIFLDDAMNLLMDKKSSKMTNSELSIVYAYELYREHQRYSQQGRLYLSGAIDSDNNFNPSNHVSQLDTVFRRLKNSGIRQILVSVDLDVLDMWTEGITATDYNPHAILLPAGIVDLNLVLNSHGYRTLDHMRRDIEFIENYFVLKHSKFDLLKYAVAKEKLISCARACIGNIIATRPPACPEKYAYKFIHQSEKEGLKVNDLLLSVNAVKRMCHKYGLVFGVKVNNTKIIGSINEGIGPDLNGKTTETALRVASEMITD